MRFFKYASVLLLVLALVGCGHGYEGEYRIKAGSSNELINALAGAAGPIEEQKIIIGSNFIESQGEREEFDDIFIRESGGEDYLVFKNKESEEVWKIIDEDTLLRGNDLMNIKLVRVD